MKVLVADKFEQSGLDGLKALGVEVEYDPELREQALIDRTHESEADILVVRSTKVPADLMEGSKLSLIIRAGAGYNTIDVEAASRLGIYVSNCPGKNSQAVAELTMGLILAIDRHIPDCVSELRAGRWNKKKFSQANGLYGRTLGLIGMGKIGQEVIARAKAFGMNVVAYSRWMTADVAAALGIGRAASLDELAAQSDVVSIHVSLTPETKGLLGEAFFQKMLPGAYFINTSRAEVVDQSALESALLSRDLFAGLDVFDGEPSAGEAKYAGPLTDNPRVYCTHHIGASTEQAQEAVAAETVRIVREYRHTGIVPNAVNVRPAEVASHLLVVRHLDRVGVLAHVLGVLKDEGVNVQEMENIVLGGAQAAIAQIALDKEPTGDALLKMKLNSNVLDSSVFPIER
ncbi:MAG: hydroxyacid dehydrogenase [Armatimonadetes bacterium]|nr:hydroxyacid dehydrogenase [Armatimonadota bacterium]